MLTLEDIYGAITFCPAHQVDIDAYMEQRRVNEEAKRQAARETDPIFYQKLGDARWKRFDRR